jgi:protocatechuate 3,4-dioxygenase beta subunit
VWTGGASPPVAVAQAACTLTPEQMEGPYYLDLARVRQDITEGKPGAPLRLAVRITEAAPSCAPIAGAPVDVWHCDALGIYSGYEGAVVAPSHVQPVNDKTFLRGTQLTDRAGGVEFRTIYPGWYTGRTTHVHVKVRVGTGVATTQFYFPEDVSRRVYQRAPYNQHPDPDTSNATDGALKGVSAKPLVMWKVSPDGDGYLAVATIAVRKS